MAYKPSGMQAMFPIYFSRMARRGERIEDYDISAAQNEGNLNQNLQTLYLKLMELEDYLASQE